MRGIQLCVVGFILAVLILCTLTFVFTQVPIMMLHGLIQVIIAMGIAALLVAACYQMGRLFFHILNKE